jgi:hypothetical protein
LIIMVWNLDKQQPSSQQAQPQMQDGAEILQYRAAVIQDRDVHQASPPPYAAQQQSSVSARPCLSERMPQHFQPALHSDVDV